MKHGKHRRKKTKPQQLPQNWGTGWEDREEKEETDRVHTLQCCGGGVRIIRKRISGD